jgi:hypothetical protein
MKTEGMALQEINLVSELSNREIKEWELIIEQFASFIDQNHEEIRTLKSDRHFFDKPQLLKRIDILNRLNQTLEDSINECLDLMNASKARCRNYEELLIPN